ncbi:MAG: hypothetical protein LBT10_03620 [Methanobrevibacter sp.]|jgi:hypothetical protein|nr:hypothetical protein [Methanobrevibacter sp.]
MVNTNSTAKVWVHSYGHGAVGSPAHWTSPNDISFNDNAWLLSYLPSYEIAFNSLHYSGFDKVLNK